VPHWAFELNSAPAPAETWDLKGQRVKGKGCFVLSPVLSECYSILNTCSSCCFILYFTPNFCFLKEILPLGVGLGVSLDISERRKFLPPAAIETPDCPACGLMTANCYPGSCIT